MRIGVGTCKWHDQSYYTGDWVQNVRHGNGMYMTEDGCKYEGQWVNDVKHGQGRLTYKDGSTLDGSWSNDRLNGLCTLKANGEAPETVIYKDDMLIQNNKTGVSSGDLVYMVCSIVMMLIFYAAIPLGAFVGDGELFSLMGVYIIYLVWSCCHAST